MGSFFIPTGRESDIYESVKPLFESTRAVVNNPFHFMCVNSDGSLQRLSKTSMVDMHQNWTLYKDPTMKKAQNFMKTWLEDPARRTLDMVDFWPPPLVAPLRSFNTFKGYAAASLDPPLGKVDLGPILHHIDVLVGHAPGGTDYMLNWLASLFQPAAARCRQVPGDGHPVQGRAGDGQDVLHQLGRQARWPEVLPLHQRRRQPTVRALFQLERAGADHPRVHR